MRIIAITTLLFVPLLLSGQSIVGKWQLMNQSTCMEDDLAPGSAQEQELVDEMKSKSNKTPQVLTFKDNNTAEENTKIINSRKDYNSRSMLYKFNGEALYLLDKKSQTIIESYSVDRISADSLIITNIERACDTKIFLKIK